MKKWVKTIPAVVLSASLALTGCGSDKGSTSASSTDNAAKATEKPAEAPKSGKKTEILFWTGFSGPDGPFMKKIVDKYNSSQDKYKVNFVIQPFNEYYKQVDVALSTNKNRPDVMVMHLDNIPSYVDKGQLKPLDEIAKTAGFSKADYIQAPVDYATIGGKWYSIPLDVHPLVMYYNKDLFQKAGIAKPPTNRTEFMDAVKKLTDKSKGQYGFAVPTLWPQQFIFPTLMLQNGGKWVDDKGEIAYNSPEAAEMLTFMRSLITDGYSPENVQQDGENTLFLQGKNAIQFNGPWMKGQFDEAKLNYGVAPVPQLGKVKQAVVAGSHNLVIPAKTEDKEVLAGIGDFLKYIGSNSLDWAESGQALASKPMLDSAQFKAMPMQTEVAKAFPYVQFAPAILNWPTISEPVWAEVSLVLLGKKDAQKALDDAAAKSKQAMKK